MATDTKLTSAFDEHPLVHPDLPVPVEQGVSPEGVVPVATLGRVDAMEATHDPSELDGPGPAPAGEAPDPLAWLTGGMDPPGAPSGG